MSWIQRIAGRFRRTRPPAGASRPAVLSSPWLQFLETNRIVSFTVLAATVAAILVVSYVGVSPVALPVQVNQLASVRITAADTFHYPSAIRTQELREQAGNRIAPVYRLSLALYERFAVHAREFAADLDRFEQQHLPAATAARAEALRVRGRELAAIVDTFNLKGPHHAAAEDVATILSLGGARFRASAFENGLVTLRELHLQGVYDNARDFTGGAAAGLAAYQIQGPHGEPVQARVQSHEEALTFLRINLAAEGVGREGSMALFRLFRNGLSANLAFDGATTARLRAQAAAAQREAVVTVNKGDVLAEPGTRISPEQYEMLVAHRQHLLGKSSVQVGGQLQLFGRILLVLAMVLGAVFYIRLEDRASLASNGRLALLALVVVINLSLVRGTYELGDAAFFVENPSAATLLPYIAPTALAPLIVAVLLSSGPAIFVALVVSLFTGVIYGNRLDVVVVTFFASMVGIFACRKARQRGRVVRAGFLAGFCVAIFAMLLGLAEHWGDPSGIEVAARQMGAGLVSGLLTGMAVVGLLPVLEALFRRTTDITLLELTDYNHPLLTLVQLDAPGTYHHSLMVANLAENAAGSIGANPLVCRVCALFHDIGKTVRPEYFTENQRDRANPHDDCTPAVSALIIKGHVREGVELAQKHRLPRLIVDAIQQHHGTTLIQFFYQRARKESRSPAPGPAAPAETPAPAGTEIPEEHFRYDGPRPRTRENAILFFADCVEAASRSLRNVTPGHLSELIERLFKERIDDGQLDDCPITYEEIARIKSSFEFTLLNMLHSRIAYPVGDPPARSAPTAATPAGNARENRPASG